MPGDRPQLYKIRRLVKDCDIDDRSHFEYLADPGADPPVWVRPNGPVNDGLPYSTIAAATKVCEHLKVANKDPDVVYHSVVPV